MLLATAMIALPAASALGAGAVVLRPVPETLHLLPVGWTSLSMVVQNDGTSEATGLTVEVTDEGGLETEVVDEGARVLPPGGTTVWRYRVSRLTTTQLPVQLLIQAKYDVDKRPGAAVVAVETVSAQPDDTDKIATVQVQTALDTVDDFTSGDIYLLVRNKSGSPIRITTSTTQPRSIQLNVIGGGTCPSYPCDIPADATGSVRYRLSANNIDETGKRLLMFHVAISWGDLANKPRHQDLFAAHPITLGLYGESELATLLRLPLLILLPGFVALAIVAALWRMGLRASPNSSAEFPLPVTTGEFWIGTILLSAMFLAGLWAVEHKNPLANSTLLDLGILSLIAVALSIGGYGTFAASRKIAFQRRTLKPTSDALDMLIRLGRLDMPSRLPVVSHGDQQGLMIEANGKVLLAPFIGFTLSDTLNAFEQVGLLRRIDNARSQPSLRAVSQILEVEQRAGHVDIKWIKRDLIATPERVDGLVLPAKQVRPILLRY